MAVDKDIGELFAGDTKVEILSVARLAQWHAGTAGGSRLGVPPIQRSLVWSNAQIVDYWDSLLRGYPAGMMLVHKASADDQARNADQITDSFTEKDYLLFDGQQRMSAILLGFGKGALKASRRLWVDIGKEGNSGDRLFELRINSTGQPYGYKPSEPNQRLAAQERKGVEWLKEGEGNNADPHEIFIRYAATESAPLFAAKCIVSMESILDAYQRLGKDGAVRKLAEIEGADIATIERLVPALQKALELQVVLQIIPSDVRKEEEYLRYFRRIGQGGTRLSDEELTYSLVKHRYPHIHNRMTAIIDAKETGRLASEIDLVLAAVRVSKALRPGTDAQDWEIVQRPTPKYVDRMSTDPKWKSVEDCFLSLIPKDGKVDFRLRQVLAGLRSALIHGDGNPYGIPSMLLARFPRNLLDTLVLLAIKRGNDVWEDDDRRSLLAFVLNWLLFVTDDGKAAEHCFWICRKESWAYDTKSMAALVLSFKDEFARKPPRSGHWDPLFAEAASRTTKLAAWEGRFIAANETGGKNPGEGMRKVATHWETMKRVLLWDQREYLGAAFPHYDPTSGKDEDLPLDFDHAIPQSKFGANWKAAAIRPKLATDDLVAFRDRRGEFGHSLGNLRWLSTPDNRGRGDGPIEDAKADRSVKDDIDRSSWNSLFVDRETAAWTPEDIIAFQSMIDRRALRIAKRVVQDGGIEWLLAQAPAEPTVTVPGTPSSPDLPAA